MMASPQHNPAHGWTIKKIALMGAGWTLLGLSPIVGLLPGPGGIPMAAAGLVLILSQSYTARRIFIRSQQRYPKILGPLRRFMRRKTAARRTAAEKPAKP